MVAREACVGVDGAQADLVEAAHEARHVVAAAALRAAQLLAIEMPTTAAAIGALVIDAAEEASLVASLFAVGELPEENGATREVPAESLLIGQVVLVRPGDRVPAYGTVLETTSGIDESPVSGGSVPRTKEPGEDVLAGSIDAEAALRVTVTRTAEDNTIARIVRLVEDAESASAPTERFIDRVSRIHMPAICAVALLVVVGPPLLLGRWLCGGLALLPTGCPCALVISVPASIASALASGARQGLLMKGGAVIEAAARTARAAFDETGTLTVGRPAVTDAVPLGADAREVLAVAASAEAGGGIDDAPALAQASVGVAKGEGTDVATETTDAAVPRSRVTEVPALIGLARAAMGNIRQNVAVALGLRAVFPVTTVLGHDRPLDRHPGGHRRQPPCWRR